MQETQKLAEFVVNTGYQDIPSDLIEKAKVYVLDNIAAGFVGSVQPWSLKVAEMARELGGNAEASMFNQKWKADVSRAALVNGAMMGAFEVEHIGHVSHPGGTVFPAALAIAQKEHVDGKSFLAAMLLGYEVTCRVGEAQTRTTERERGFHNPCVNGVFGAATAVSKLLSLDEQQTAWAMGIAGSHSGGLVEFMWEGAMTKRLHLGRAAQSGLESALLASKGFTGPTTVLEGPFGFLNAFSPTPKPEMLLDVLGETWLSDSLTIKAYACHVTGQAVVHAIQQFRSKHTFNPQEVGRIILTGDSHIADTRHLDREPKSILGGQYSLAFTLAIALCKDMSNPLNFNEGALRDPLIRDLAKRLEVVEDNERFEEGAKPSVELTVEIAGQSHVIPIQDFPGSPTQPLDFDGASEKLRNYTRDMVGQERIEQIIEMVKEIQDLPDVAKLAKLLESPS